MPILETALDIVPRLRRFGRIMLGGREDVDARLVQAVIACRGALLNAPDMEAAANILFASAIAHLETESRALNAIAILPTTTEDIPLLPAVWALPYDERLALALLYVEELEPQTAGSLCATTTKTLRDRAETAVARLLGVLPFPGRVSPTQLRATMSSKTPPPSSGRKDAPVVKSHIRKLARKMLADESSDAEIKQALLRGETRGKKDEGKPG